MTPQTALLHTGAAWRNKAIRLSGVERLTDSQTHGLTDFPRLPQRTSTAVSHGLPKNLKSRSLDLLQ